MSGQTNKDAMRQQFIRVAARQFSRKSYTLVSLADIVADTELTNAAMYFHFRSKQALALAIIDEFHTMTRAAIEELLSRNLSGLETAIDACYLFAHRYVVSDIA